MEDIEAAKEESIKRDLEVVVDIEALKEESTKKNQEDVVDIEVLKEEKVANTKLNPKVMVDK